MYTQADRPLRVRTPLGDDALLIEGFSGGEAISEPFRFHLDLIAPNENEVPFHELLGQKVSVELDLPDGEIRHWSGLCSRVSRGERGTIFTAYRIELVPELWLLTHRARSAVYQRLAVPDILKRVLGGLDVAFELEGTFHPREFCVQYRETDFQFVSRLMEEEGIFYFFKHRSDGHTMVVANTPDGHPDVPAESVLLYESIEGGTREEHRVHEWEKAQELRAGKYVLFDHCFELPHKHLEAEDRVLEAVDVGEVTHKLKLDRNDKLEIYDYPGEYAQRFDGVDRGGGNRPAELQKIFEDNKRTVRIRMEEETLPSLVIRGRSDCGQLVSGHKFTLERHFDADDAYVLTKVAHTARMTDYRSGKTTDFHYENTFACIPLALPFRPKRATPRPTVQGTQTAVVVGPAGEEIFTDKYGRVKIQFHWDREGKNDADSSCWVRVATPWAGKQWGMIHIPRVGQEVVVDFLEGDPDRPIILGSVYNAEQMPPYTLPGNKTQSGLKSRSSLKGGDANFNEIRMEDGKGKEQLYIHAEKNQDIAVENDETHWVGHDRTKQIDNDETIRVQHDRTERVGRNHEERIGSNMTIEVGSNLDETVSINYSETVGAAMELSVGGAMALTVGAVMVETVGGSKSETIGGSKDLNTGKSLNETIGDSRDIQVAKDVRETVGGRKEVTVTKEYLLQAKKIQIVAQDEIDIKTGNAEIVMKKNGDITVKGKKISIKGDGDVVIKGSKILEN